MLQKEEKRLEWVGLWLISFPTHPNLTFLVLNLLYMCGVLRCHRSRRLARNVT